MFDFGVKPVAMTTPKCEVRWAKVIEPDYKFDDNGIYSIDCIVNTDDPDMVAMLQKLEVILDAAWAKWAKENPAKAKQYTKAPIVREYIDSATGDSTGVNYIHIKTKAVDAKGNDKKVPIYDRRAQKDTSGTLIGNGSICKVGFSAAPYEVASSKTIGLSLYLNAVQVIDLVEYSGGNFDFTDEGDDDALPDWASAS